MKAMNILFSQWLGLEGEALAVAEAMKVDITALKRYAEHIKQV